MLLRELWDSARTASACLIDAVKLSDLNLFATAMANNTAALEGIVALDIAYVKCVKYSST